VTVDQYRSFRQDGYLIVRNLMPKQDIEELRQHTEDMMQGRLPEQQGMDEADPDAVREATEDERKHKADKRHDLNVRKLFKPAAHLSPIEKAKQFLRIHMLHRQMEIHERYLLHPRVLDILEVLIGPDVLAMQTMLFLKPPGSQGQGWHQDSYYIPTSPDTLCGAWIAIDDADEYNGGLWFAKGSGSAPIYPPCPAKDVYGFGDRHVSDIRYIENPSNPDDQVNSLTAQAEQYDHALGSVKAGDVVFFNGHVMHRSKQNITEDRFRRAFVSHYCNARSFTAWGRDENNPDGHDAATGSNNGSHILARGDTHLAFAKPRFGTPCAATLPAEERSQYGKDVARRIAATGNGLMGCAIDNLDQLTHDHSDDDHDNASGAGY
jgi:hypothetical protein